MEFSSYTFLIPTWESGRRTLEKGCSERATTEICSPPRLREASCLWRQKTNPYRKEPEEGADELDASGTGNKGLAAVLAAAAEGERAEG